MNINENLNPTDDQIPKNLEDLPLVKRFLQELDEMEKYQDEWMEKLTG